MFQRKCYSTKLEEFAQILRFLKASDYLARGTRNAA